mgnify:CR=1 FL=1
MKIAIVKDQIPYPCANVINTLKHAHALYKCGHQVEVLVLDQFFRENSKIQRNKVHNFFGINKGIVIRYFKGNLIFYLSKLRFISPIVWLIKKIPILYYFLDPERKISQYIRDNNFDLVYCRNTHRVAYFSILNKISTIIESHSYNMETELSDVIKISNEKYFKGIITVSNLIKKNYIKNGFPENKILVLEDALDLEKFEKIKKSKITLRKELNLPLKKRIILYSGKMEVDWVSYIILDSAKILENKDFYFYFLGGTKKDIKSWKEYCKNKKIHANIRFLGFQPFNQIPNYLKAADVLLITYAQTCPIIDWISPIKIFEYMGSKTPFIATKIKRLEEICNNNECLFHEPDDPNDLANKIIKLVENKKLQDIIVKNAVKKAKKHTYILRCEKILKFINKK